MARISVNSRSRHSRRDDGIEEVDLELADWLGSKEPLWAQIEGDELDFESEVLGRKTMKHEENTRLVFLELSMPRRLWMELLDEAKENGVTVHQQILDILSSRSI